MVLGTFYRLNAIGGKSYRNCNDATTWQQLVGLTFGRSWYSVQSASPLARSGRSSTALSAS